MLLSPLWAQIIVEFEPFKFEVKKFLEAKKKLVAGLVFSLAWFFSLACSLAWLGRWLGFLRTKLNEKNKSYMTHHFWLTGIEFKIFIKSVI